METHQEDIPRGAFQLQTQHVWLNRQEAQLVALQCDVSEDTFLFEDATAELGRTGDEEDGIRMGRRWGEVRVGFDLSYVSKKRDRNEFLVLIEDRIQGWAELQGVQAMVFIQEIFGRHIQTTFFVGAVSYEPSDEASFGEPMLANGERIQGDERLRRARARTASPRRIAIRTDLAQRQHTFLLDYMMARWHTLSKAGSMTSPNGPDKLGSSTSVFPPGI
jgi:hypothetical protein